MKLSLTILSGLILLSPLAWVEELQTITINPAVHHQTIDGFGASDSWSMQHIGKWSDDNKNKIADLLFSKDNGIGLSIWRFNLGAGLDHDHIKNPWRTVETFEVAEGQYDWPRQAAEQWFLYAARKRGVQEFVAFSISPTKRMTRNGFTACTEEVGTTNLKEGYEGQYARYLADILYHFEHHSDPSKRIDFKWISPINEPQWEWNVTHQEGSRYSNKDLMRVIKALDAELTRQNLDTFILTPESGHINHFTVREQKISDKYGAPYGKYADLLCNEPALAKRLNYTLAGHAYWADLIPSRLEPNRNRFRITMKKYPDWKYRQTEYCVMQGPENKGGGGRDLGMETALNVARVIHCDLTLTNAIAWTWWLAVSDANFKDGLLYTDWKKPGDEENILLSKTFYALGHYSRFLRPGSTRIALEGAHDVQGLMGSAWHSLEHGLVIVLVNAAEKDCRIALRTAVKSFDAYLTTDTAGDNLRWVRGVEAQAPLMVPARAIMTLVQVQ